MDEHNFIFNGKRLEALERNVQEARDAALQGLGMLQADRAAHEVWHRDIWTPHQERNRHHEARIEALEKARANKWPTFLTSLLAQMIAAGVVWLTIFSRITAGGG